MHPPDSALPNEQVDPASGTLMVVATDLVLPGNAGFNLSITRVYNSSVFPDYDTGSSTALEEDSWAGIGWKLHFGRIVHADSISAGQMTIEMGDGSRHPLYHSMANPYIWTTAEFWLYNPTTNTLQFPNGRVYTFGRQVTINDRLGTVRYVTEIRDPFNNVVTFDYFDASGPIDGVAAIHQVLSSTETRDITFTYDPTFKALASMTYRNHTWTYDQVAGGPAGFSVLSVVHPPMGPTTSYDYSGPAGATGEMTAIHAPFGGTIAYVYGDAARVAGSLTITTRVVQTRTMSGHDVPTGTWTFSYGTGANHDTTTVLCPCGGTTSYRFNGTGTTIDTHGWLAGTLAELKTIETNGTVLETRTLTWQRSEPVSSDPAVGQNGVWADDAIYRPLLQQTVVTRAGSTLSWTTNYSYHSGAGTFNDYGNPYYIEEFESTYRWRHTTRTFQTGFAPYIIGAVASTTVVQNSAYGQNDGTTTASVTYDLATGFVTSQTARGITTSLTPRADGNVASVTDALGHTTSFTYAWGHVASVQTPLLTTTYIVIPEGLVTSETQGALTTTYDYDVALRLSAVHPPGTNPITYQPDDLHGGYVRVLRGSSVVTHVVDAFGREVLTYNSQNLNVATQRDTCGRVTFSSHPYVPGGAYIGTTVVYDAMGRVTQSTDAAGQHTTLAYIGAQVQRTDPDNHITIFDYLAFGDPGGSQVWRVTDALGHITTYRYDVTGALSNVSGPLNGLQRTWTINIKGLPDSDSQPESGTTSYAYDGVGNLISTTNANGDTTTFTYDANNRLTGRDAPGSVDDLAVTYDPTGRVATLTAEPNTANTRSTTFTYDVANRIVTKADTTPLGTLTSSYTSDANDNLTHIGYPSGRLVTYHYDAENRLTSFDHRPTGTQADVPFATNFTYGTDGRLASYVTGAVTHNFSYEAGRPKRLWTTGGTDALDLTYGYDNAGNVTSISDPRPNATQTFVPDPLDRLTSATGPWGTLDWSYDAAGNRLSETASGVATTYSYSASTQRLTSTTGGANESFGYDSVGRVSSDAMGTYAYSPLGKLTGFIGTGVSASYSYDPSGERFSKTVNNQVAYSVRSLGGQTLSEYVSACGSAVWARDLLYAGGQLIGAAKATATQPTVAMTASSLSVTESVGTTTLNLQLTTPNGAALGCPVTVSYATFAGTATAGADYPAATGNVTFAAGAANGSTQSIAIGIVSDSVDEPNETFTVGITSATGATVAATNNTAITILDDDPPTIFLTDATLSVNEATGTATISVKMTSAVTPAPAASVQYATANVTAAAGYDYTATSGTLTFAVGGGATQIQTILVPITSDGLHEGDETFTLTLSSPSGAQIVSPSTVTVTVVDDDPVPQPEVRLDAPAEGSQNQSTITMTGWAIDRAAISGTGIDGVRVLAFPNADLTQTPITMPTSGSASYGGWSQWVADNRGPQFGPSAFTLTWMLPGPGTYLLIAQGHDPLAGTWVSAPSGTTITVGPTPRMSVDTPHAGTVAAYFNIGGWAIDTGAGTSNGGTGVDVVDVWAYPNPGSGQDPIWVGEATYGVFRPDVGAAFGSQFTPSGFNLIAHLADGTYQLAVFARSTVTGTFNQVQTVNVLVTSQWFMTIEFPAANYETWTQPFGITGWAVDTSVPSGNGIDAVHIYAYLNGTGPAIWIGAAGTGGDRSDISAWLQDSRFAPSGWGQLVTGLPPGTYFFVLYPHSTVNGFFYPQGRWIVVQ